MNAFLFFFSAGVQTLAEKGGMKFNSSLIKSTVDVTDFEGSQSSKLDSNIWMQIHRGVIDCLEGDL